MSSPNYAGNIIVNLANLPDFLRKPILKKRMDEFFTMQAPDRLEVINNALAAGPTIPFPNFSKLFKTWLEILADIDEEKRTIMFTTYIFEILKEPQKIILFNLDGILEVFLSLEQPRKDAIVNSIRQIIAKLSAEDRRKMELVVPQNAMAQFSS